jgi:hypothetical protein
MIEIKPDHVIVEGQVAVAGREAGEDVANPIPAAALIGSQGGGE